jgi:NTE family protein
LQHSKTHLFPNAELARVIASLLGASTTFADLVLPFAAVAMDVDSARPHVMGSGPRQRAAAAGIVHGRPLAGRAGLQLSRPPPSTPQSPAETVLFAVTIMMRTQVVLEAPVVAARVPVVYLPGPVAHRVSPLHFDHTELLIEEAYDASGAFLEGIEVVGPGLYGSPTAPLSDRWGREKHRPSPRRLAF